MEKRLIVIKALDDLDMYEIDHIASAIEELSKDFPQYRWLILPRSLDIKELTPAGAEELHSLFHTENNDKWIQSVN
jgi:hypothetical protein